MMAATSNAINRIITRHPKRFWCKLCECGDGRLKEFLMRSRSENSCPNVWSSSGPARQVSSLELLFPNLLYKLNAADGCRRCLESLEPEHRPSPLFDSAMILLHNVVQVLAGSYPNTARYRSR
jgi:hypothetical protein